MKMINAVISLVLIGFSSFYAFLIWKLPSRDLPHTLGAAFVPWVLFGCLFILSLFLLFEAFFLTEESNKMRRLAWKNVGGIVGLLALIVIYVQVMKYLGFLISTMIFLAILTLISGAKKPLEILLFSVVATAAIYFLFYHFFNVQLPTGDIF